MFVAFNGEENGRQGSAAFVKEYVQAQDPPVDVRAMLNLDSIGSAVGSGGETDRQSMRLFSAEPNDSSSRQLARQVALVIKTYVPDLEPILQSAEERTGRWGDQQSFSASNYAAVRLIQGIEDVSREHTSRDTIDNVQAADLMQTTRAALASLVVLADGPQPPSDLVIRPVIDDPANQRLIWTPVPGAAMYLVTLRLATSLSYDQIFTVQAAPTSELTWTGFGRYATVAIAAIDSAGHMGPLSPEATIASLVRQQ